MKQTLQSLRFVVPKCNTKTSNKIQILIQSLGRIIITKLINGG